MFLVVVRKEQGVPAIIGVSRALINPENTDAEFAILMLSEERCGFGRILTLRLSITAVLNRPSKCRNDDANE